MYLLKTNNWHLLRTVFLISGIFVVGSVLIGLFIYPYAFYFTALVGLMQIIFALTGFCPMAILLNKFGFREQ